MNIATVEAFYQHLPRLETPRLVLRQIRQEDTADIFAYASDAEVTRFLRWEPHQSQAQTASYVGEVLTGYQTGQDGPWALEDRASQHVIGQVHLMDLQLQHRKAQVGFVLARPCWNRGLMTEALGKVLEYVFEIGLNRVEAWPICEHRAATRVLEKVGMTKEGLLRESDFQKGRFRDFFVYAILRRDYLRVAVERLKPR